MIQRVLSKLKTEWLRTSFAFNGFGKSVSVDWTAEIARQSAPMISLGDNVYIAPGVWLNVEDNGHEDEAKIVLGTGSKIGRRSVISAKNQIVLGSDVLLAPAVLIMDHNHEYSDTNRPVHLQGTTVGGRIVIEKNCWLGYGAVIFCARGELVIGHNSVVGANSVVTRSIPPGSVVAGNPAQVVKHFDLDSQSWVRDGVPKGLISR